MFYKTTIFTSLGKNPNGTLSVGEGLFAGAEIQAPWREQQIKASTMLEQPENDVWPNVLLKGNSSVRVFVCMRQSNCLPCTHENRTVRAESSSGKHRGSWQWRSPGFRHLCSPSFLQIMSTAYLTYFCSPVTVACTFTKNSQQKRYYTFNLMCLYYQQVAKNSGHWMFWSWAGLLMQMKVCLNLKPQFMLQLKLRLEASEDSFYLTCSPLAHMLNPSKAPVLKIKVVQMFGIYSLSLIPNFPLTNGRVCTQAKGHLWPLLM